MLSHFVLNSTDLINLNYLSLDFHLSDINICVLLMATILMVIYWEIYEKNPFKKYDSFIYQRKLLKSSNKFLLDYKMPSSNSTFVRLPENVKPTLYNAFSHINK